MDPILQANFERVTRRQLFGRTATGVGAAALASLLGQDASLAPVAATPLPAKSTSAGRTGQPGFPNFAPRAKRGVYLWQGGGRSHIDLFDPKPTLQRMAMQDLPESVRGGTRLSTMTASYKKWPCVPGIKPYTRYGKSGIELSTMIPHTGSIADDLCVVRSMNTEAVNHAPGVTFFLTGAQVPGRPSMGAWLSYGLGCESSDLPAFVVMTSSDKGKTCGQLFFDYYWGSGFLPSRYQGVRFRNTGDPVPYLANPAGVSPESRRALLDDINDLNEQHLWDYGDPEIETRIGQYQMAFRMQTSVPGLLDFSNEPKSVI